MIERVEHPAQWQSYITYRDLAVAPSNNGDPNEKMLFHGTDVSTISKISSGVNQSFDRAHTITHAYGKGVYFATDASYSANTSYSKVDPATGKQKMFYARVSVGMFAKGARDMIAPPERIDAAKKLWQ